MSPLLSIIVPVYKSEAYLYQCINSILSQSFYDYELLLIDDGSPDNSGNICEEFASNDTRIKVIHTENRGVSAARNTGIKNAKGEYVTFVDSDDIISHDTYSCNMDILLSDRSIDLLEYPVYVHYQSAEEYIWKIEDKHVHGLRETFIYWIKTKGYLRSYLCNKIFKRELFKDISFPYKKTFEDTFITPLIVERTHHIYFSSYGLYYYYSRDNSITKRGMYSDFCNLLEANISIWKHLEYYPELMAERDQLYLCSVDVLIDIYRITKEDITNIPKIEEIKKLRFSLQRLFSLNIPLFVKFKNITLSLFGLERHCRLISYLKL